MTDKELIKQEIKRRISNLEQIGDRKEIEIHFPEQFKFIKMYEGLLQFIDSLPEEEPIVKEITRKDVNTDDIEEPASDDLEEYAKKLTKEAGLDKHNLIWMCKKGAEWQKKQMKEALQTEYEKGLFDMQQEMMKDAVDATILDVDAQTIEFGLWPEKLLDIKEGDKVKIIIIKEE
jgi:hypothetical protein